MRGKAILQVLNVLGFLLVIGVNYAANAVPINNLDTGTVSDLYPNLFTPAGFTFSIWGLIYFLLLGFTVFQARDWFKPNKLEMDYLKNIGYLFFISSLLNAAWIFAWHYLQVLLSLLIMVLLLIVLIKIYLKLDIGRKTVPSNEAFWVHLPFRVYLGWITIATIANVTAVLVDLNWGRFGLSEAFWTVSVIVAATIITIAFLKLRQDLAVGLVSIWALLGIVVKRLTEEPVETAVIAGAVAAIIVIAIFALYNTPKSLDKILER